MDWAIVLALVGAISVVTYLLARKGGEVEALKKNSAMKDTKIDSLEGEVLADYTAKKDREDRHAEELRKTKSAAGARELLRDATDDDFN